jgi:hypothetical protein
MIKTTNSLFNSCDLILIIKLYFFNLDAFIVKEESNFNFKNHNFFSLLQHRLLNEYIKGIFTTFNHVISNLGVLLYNN